MRESFIIFMLFQNMNINKVFFYYPYSFLTNSLNYVYIE